MRICLYQSIGSYLLEIRHLLKPAHLTFGYEDAGWQICIHSAFFKILVQNSVGQVHQTKLALGYQ